MADGRAAQRALAVIGAATAGVVAFRALRCAAWWAYLRCGPVLADKYKGEYAIVTGGSEGIGLGIASALAARGVNLVLISRSDDKLSKAAAHLKAEHPGVAVVTVAADLTAGGAVGKVTKALDRAGVRDKCSLLFCNAGGGLTRAALYHEFSDKEEEAVRKLNGDATYALVREFLPAMRARGRGYVVCTSSLIVKMPWARLSTYYLEKVKVNGLATVLQAEQDATGSGVGVQAHALGAVVTPALVSFVAPDAAAAARAGRPAIGWEREYVRPSFLMPSAGDVGEWMLRAMGKGGSAVVTPHPGHALAEALVSDVALALTWPGCLRRAVARRFAQTWEPK
ncbi:hypothetical protein Rsub_09374 [Raphidocelis subcapitata]|uniref:Uncharacterized protein n=1 Tax=Raphidocelis subcapitata TaxID=307507 RepID=A0A2V0P9U0_9CHLO|nr:hypothetical protein Rsub_09374 [Raphidocelis subcapitata]|eukprot:GBF96628.1 hypothetical protein Rsub_09374 [Raphidocelis subcapitata]